LAHGARNRVLDRPRERSGEHLAPQGQTAPSLSLTVIGGLPRQYRASVDDALMMIEVETDMWQLIYHHNDIVIW
jgi:hypothetical protein